MLLDDGLLPEDFSTNYISRHNSDRKPAWFANYRGILIKLGAQLCRVNFNQNFDPKRYSKPKEPLWSDFLYYFHFYFTIKELVIMYHHFVVDYYKYKLDRFDQVISHYRHRGVGPLRTEYESSFRQQLVNDYESARSTIDKIGAPYVHFHYLVEILAIYSILGVSSAYLLPQFYYRFWKPFDYNTTYVAIAPERLQESIDAMIAEQVNLFITSSRAFISQLIDQKRDALVVLKWRRDRLAQRHPNDANWASDPMEERPPVIAEYDCAGQVESFANNHRFLVQQVKFMATNGDLQPFNRRAGWLDKLANIYGLLSISTMLFFAAWLLVFEITVPFVDAPIERRVMDLLCLQELFIFVLTGFTAAMIYVTMTAVVCWDQAYLVSKLNQSIESHIVLSDRRRLADIDNDMRVSISRGDCAALCTISPRTTSRPTARTRSSGCSGDLTIPPTVTARFPEHQTEIINVCLLRTILHYKIFAKQLKDAFSPIPVFTTIALCISFIMPVTTRILIAYLDPQIKQVALLISLIILVSCDLGSITVSWMHARCLGVYRRLHSLLAHTISSDDDSESRTGRAVYDRHLVWLLRKELSDPDSFLDQFSVSFLVLNSKITYASLLKYHFWWGILTLSIMVLDQTLPNASDVFGGVLRFYIQADIEVNQFLYNYTQLGPN